jgi:hypothetical protein
MFCLSATVVNLGGVQFQGETMAHAAASLNSKAPPLFEIKKASEPISYS